MPTAEQQAVLSYPFRHSRRLVSAAGSYFFSWGHLDTPQQLESAPASPKRIALARWTTQSSRVAVCNKFVRAVPHARRRQTRKASVCLAPCPVLPRSRAGPKNGRCDVLVMAFSAESRSAGPAAVLRRGGEAAQALRGRGRWRQVRYEGSTAWMIANAARPSATRKVAKAAVSIPPSSSFITTPFQPLCLFPPPKLPLHIRRIVLISSCHKQTQAELKMQRTYVRFLKSDLLGSFAKRKPPALYADT